MYVYVHTNTKRNRTWQSWGCGWLLRRKREKGREKGRERRERGERKERAERAREREKAWGAEPVKFLMCIIISILKLTSLGRGEKI